MSVETTPQFQKNLLMKLLGLTEELNGALDRLDEEVRKHGNPSSPGPPLEEWAEGKDVEETLGELARKHAAVMETLIRSDLGRIPELLDLAREAQEKVRHLMARLEESRNRTLDALSSHRRRQKGAAAYALEAMRMN